jgi:hypothetical protein
VRARDDRTLVADETRIDGLLAAGLLDPDAWSRSIGAHRGASGTLRLEDGASLILKKMRRGGLLAPLWRDRYAGARRLLDNLRLPLEAARRGIATPPPVALLLRRSGGGLYEGWLATEELRGAVDLRTRLAAPPPPGDERMATVLAAVRAAHDVGLEHRDLNLGNLMLREPGEDSVEVFLIDLDRARLHPGPLDFHRRRAALRRLERSYVKCFGADGPWGDRDGAFWFELYAAGDADLIRRFAAGRRVDRALLALHRLGWRR